MATWPATGYQDCAANGAENTNGTVWNYGTTAPNSAYLGVGYGGLRHHGWRWTNVTIPQGASITSATLQINMTCDFSPFTASVYAEDADNAGTMSGSGRRPSTWTLTTASAAIASSPGSGLETVGITSVIQEIVDRTGWSSGNALNLAGIGAGTGNKFMCVELLPNAGTNPAKLKIVYTAASGANLGALAGDGGLAGQGGLAGRGGGLAG